MWRPRRLNSSGNTSAPRSRNGAASPRPPTSGWIDGRETARRSNRDGGFWTIALFEVVSSGPAADQNWPSRSAAVNSAIRPALHRNRLPAFELGLRQHRRIDAAHRPFAGERQREFLPDAALARRIEAGGG